MKALDSALWTLANDSTCGEKRYGEERYGEKRYGEKRPKDKRASIAHHGPNRLDKKSLQSNYLTRSNTSAVV